MTRNRVTKPTSDMPKSMRFTMKHRIFQTSIPFAVLFLMTLASKSVYADLNALEIYNTFKSMNGGQGFRFVPDRLVSPTLVTLTTQTDYQNVDNSAYIAGRGGSVGSPSQTFFETFCVAPELLVSSVGLGKLNYNETTGLSKTSEGHTLTLGAAYLYKEYATSLTPLGITGEVDSMDFALAIRALMGIRIVSKWTENVYLNALLDINDSKEYWTKRYQVNQKYSEIGDYCVFVINVTDTDGLGQYQDFLYIAPAEGTPDVPEPVTILLWSLGGMGLFGTSLARKRRMKK